MKLNTFPEIGKLGFSRQAALDSRYCIFTCEDISTLSHVQRRRGSKDAAGDEKSEWERRLDKPSVPLKAIGDPGPPR